MAAIARRSPYPLGADDPPFLYFNCYSGVLTSALPLNISTCALGFYCPNITADPFTWPQVCVCARSDRHGKITLPISGVVAGRPRCCVQE